MSHLANVLGDVVLPVVGCAHDGKADLWCGDNGGGMKSLSPGTWHYTLSVLLWTNKVE